MIDFDLFSFDFGNKIEFKDFVLKIESLLLFSFKIGLFSFVSSFSLFNSKLMYEL